MSSQYTPVPRAEGGELHDGYDDDAHGQGLVTFAGVMIMVAAVLNTLYGIAAIDTATFFVNDARYVFGDLAYLGLVPDRTRRAPGIRRVRDLARRPPGDAGSASRPRASTWCCR